MARPGAKNRLTKLNAFKNARGCITSAKKFVLSSESFIKNIPMVSIRLFLLCVLLAAVQSQLQAQANIAYNKALADSLGADDYGMKSYVLVILKTGAVKMADKAKSDSLFGGHLKNIGRLASEGKLTVAGPLQKNDKDYRGIFILNVKTREEAKALLETDPAVKAGLLEPELYGWYGSAALPMYLKYHDEVQKKAF